MDKAKVLIVIVLIFSIASVSNALNIVYVDVSGPNNPGTGSFDDPFRKVQDAIDDANNGDIIEIRPGVYTGEGNYDLDPNGKSVTIRSIDPNDSNVVASTTIDPNEAGRGFYFDSGEDANCVVSGLTIRNGHTGGKGGGIYCDNSSPTIINCIISGNYAGFYGGGLFCQLSDLKIIGCVIRGNSAVLDGGGLECWSGNPILTNSVISYNLALIGNGGGVDCYDAGNPTLTNCSLVKNTADFGGGLYGLGSEMVVKNSIFWANDADLGPQIALDTSSSVSIEYSDVQGGETVVYDPGNGLVWDSNNIDTDPCFASFDPNGDPNIWDFHLQSVYGRWDTGFYRIDFDKDGIVNLLDFARLAGVWLKNGDNLPEDLNRNGTVDWADLQIFTEYYLTAGYGGEWVSDAVTSLCIDAGDPNSDWGNEPWPNGKRINMGAYGGTNQASKNGNPADFNIDGMVNFIDFAALAGRWMDEQKCIEDLTGNGIVSYSDLAIVADNWLWQR